MRGGWSVPLVGIVLTETPISTLPNPKGFCHFSRFKGHPRPQHPQKRVYSSTLKINFLYSVFQILAIWASHKPYKHPHVKGQLSKGRKFWERKIWKKKIEKKNQKKKIFSNFFFSGFPSFRQLTLDMGVFIRFMGSPDCKDFKNAMEEVNFRDT